VTVYTGFVPFLTPIAGVHSSLAGRENPLAAVGLKLPKMAARQRTGKTTFPIRPRPPTYVIWPAQWGAAEGRYSPPTRARSFFSAGRRGSRWRCRSPRSARWGRRLGSPGSWGASISAGSRRGRPRASPGRGGGEGTAADAGGWRRMRLGGPAGNMAAAGGRGEGARGSPAPRSPAWALQRAGRLGLCWGARGGPGSWWN